METGRRRRSPVALLVALTPNRRALNRMWRRYRRERRMRNRKYEYDVIGTDAINDFLSYNRSITTV